MAKKAQTEAKAKGLVKDVGDYKGRTLNLTKKQVAKSGVKGARRAASAKGTSISDTKFVKGKGVMAGGKLFTGNVDLGGGNIAVYVRGKRVRAKDTKGTSKRNPPPGLPKENKITPPPSGSGSSRAMPPYGKRIPRSNTTPPASPTSVQQSGRRNPKRAAGVEWNEKLRKWIYG